MPWFGAVASWATSGALPADFVKFVSAEELRVQLRAGRPFSAALLDAGMPSMDRDVVQGLRDHGVAPILVEATGVQREWRELGAAAVLPATFARGQLLDALRATAQPIAVSAVPGVPDDTAEDAEPSRRAALIAVCGPGGTGSSSVAVALAQGLAAHREPRSAPVLLADLCRNADQAVLHDARDIVPGVQELVEAFRNRRLDPDETRALTFRVVERDYHLLLGLRRSLNWTAIRPRAFEAALAGLRGAFSVVVADVEPDLDGERETGSLDIEERHVMSRTTIAASSLVVLVGRTGISGVHAMVRCAEVLLDHGVDAERILPVITPAPRATGRRAEVARAFAELVDRSHAGTALASPVFLPRRRVDDALRDGMAVPRPLPGLLARPVTAMLERVDIAPVAPVGPEPVRPGSLGLDG